MKSLLSVMALLSATLSFASMRAVEPKVAWDKGSIRVCFGNDDHKSLTRAIRNKNNFIQYNKDQKKWIKEIITQEFQLSESGIEFTGWEDCDDKATNADVVLLRYETIEPKEEGPFTESGGKATLGQRGEVNTKTDQFTHITNESYEKSIEPHLNYVILNTRGESERRIEGEYYLKLNALHEFGHTAGLRHQHIRLKEALEDSNCQRQKTLKLPQEPIFDSTVITGPYDFNSIMNYCYINTVAAVTGLKFRARDLDDVLKLTDETLFTTKEVKNIWGKPRLEISLRVGLSALDKHALKCLYVFDEATKNERCNYPL